MSEDSNVKEGITNINLLNEEYCMNNPLYLAINKQIEIINKKKQIKQTKEVRNLTDIISNITNNINNNTILYITCNLMRIANISLVMNFFYYIPIFNL